MVKTLLVAVLIVLSTVSVKAQDFSLVSLIGQGIEWDNNLQFSQYQSNTNIEPTMTIDKWYLSVVSSSRFTDSVVSFYAGLQTGYAIVNNESGSLNLFVSSLFGDKGKQLYGAGSEYNSNRIIYRLNLMRDFKNNVNSLELGVGYKIIQ